MTASAASDSRLSAVARAYLSPRASPIRCIAIAGARQAVSPTEVGRTLLEAAAELSIPTRLIDLHESPLEERPDAGSGLWIVVLGQPDARSLRRLPAPGSAAGPELLLWCLGRGRPSLGDLYVFGLWSWSMAPRATRCIVPEAPDAGTRAELTRHGLASELLPWPERPAAARRLGLGILQSTLSAAAAQSAAFGARSLQAGPRRAIEGTERS